MTTDSQSRPGRPRMNRRRAFAFVPLYFSALFLVTSPATCMRAGLLQERHDTRLREDPQYLQYADDMDRVGGAPDARNAAFYRSATSWFALAGGAFAACGLGLLFAKRSR
jgi:hypothetical protein